MYVTRSESKNTGLGLFSVLQVIFIVLKLCNLINWSWWAVLIPTWISLGLLVIILLFFVGVAIWNDMH